MLEGSRDALRQGRQRLEAVKDQLLIITHAVLVGLTPLIPIPVLDDLVKGWFYRNLIQALAALHGLALTPAEVGALAEERNTGCLNGCLFWLFEYLVKRLVRKVVFFLEWRRAIDLVTHTYYIGHLLNYAFAQKLYAPGDPARAAALRTAIEQARKGANTHLVKRTVTSSFNRSRQSIINTVQLISSSLNDIAFRRSRLWVRRTIAVRLRQRAPRLARRLYRFFKPSEQENEQLRRAESEVGERLAREAPYWQTALEAVIGPLYAGLTALPRDHFEALEKKLRQALEAAPPQPEASPGR